MRRSVAAAGPWAKQYGYVRAVRVGELIEVSGTTAIDREGRVVAAGDAYQQTRTALAIIDGALHALGATRGAIVRTRLLLRHITDFDLAARAHVEYFEGIDLPTSTCVGGVELLHPDLVVEVEATALLSADS